MNRITSFVITSLFTIFMCQSVYSQAPSKSVKLKIIETTDVHGNFFTHDFIDNKPSKGGLARVDAYVKSIRNSYGDLLLLIDNGDILQGQPTPYYYNYINTTSPHACAEVMNYMKYDLGNLGNHDVETGHAVYDRWISQCDFPILGANIIDKETDKPYLQPYKVFNREGVKILVLGMLTPAIPAWLSENLWEGLRFEDIKTSAETYIKQIRETEKPDIVIGLFHSGKDASKSVGGYNENAAFDVAEEIDGFDVILYGHDHQRECSQVANKKTGKKIWMVNPANNAEMVGEVDITVDFYGNKKEISIQSKITNVANIEPTAEFTAKFNSTIAEVKKFVSKRIGTFDCDIYSRDAYFGPCAFIDLLHTLQMEISGAEISMVAPLSYDTAIHKGDVYVSDMFKLYKYENMLYVLNLSGEEIKGFLEHSYELWTNQMTDSDSHIMRLRETPTNGEAARSVFEKPTYNFDSAAGIIYTVDVTKPAGEKINIISMSDGAAFDMNKRYKVAVNSYRGNGGGDHLLKGSKIPANELPSRICFATDKDLRFYLMKHIEEVGTISPKALNTWKFIPEDLAAPALTKDRKFLFGDR